MPEIMLHPDIHDTPDEIDLLDATIVDKPFDVDRAEAIWLYRTRIFFLALASFCSAATIVAYLWHLLVPAKWRWLASNDLARIEGLAITIIVGLVMSGATTYFFKKKP
jgi:hypothetical protein